MRRLTTNLALAFGLGLVVLACASASEGGDVAVPAGVSSESGDSVEVGSDSGGEPVGEGATASDADHADAAEDANAAGAGPADDAGGTENTDGGGDGEQSDAAEQTDSETDSETSGVAGQAARGDQGDQVDTSDVFDVVEDPVFVGIARLLGADEELPITTVMADGVTVSVAATDEFGRSFVVFRRWPGGEIIGVALIDGDYDPTSTTIDDIILSVRLDGDPGQGASVIAFDSDGIERDASAEDLEAVLQAIREWVENPPSGPAPDLSDILDIAGLPGLALPAPTPVPPPPPTAAPAPPPTAAPAPPPTAAPAPPPPPPAPAQCTPTTTFDASGNLVLSSDC